MGFSPSPDCSIQVPDTHLVQCIAVQTHLHIPALCCPTTRFESGTAFEAAAGCSDAWLAFLRVPIPERLLKSVLPVVTTTVVTNMKNPVALSDFLTRATNQGGLVGILALHGLFILVTQHGLEHPQFYKCLYSLLTAQVFPRCNCVSTYAGSLFMLSSVPMEDVTSSAHAHFLDET